MHMHVWPGNYGHYLLVSIVSNYYVTRYKQHVKTNFVVLPDLVRLYHCEPAKRQLMRSKGVWCPLILGEGSLLTGVLGCTTHSHPYRCYGLPPVFPTSNR